MITSFLQESWWFSGIVLLFVVPLGLTLYAFLTNLRRLKWFYGASFFAAALFFAAQYYFPLFFRALIAYRPDWSLIYLIQHYTFSAFVTQFVLYFAWYSLLGLCLIIILAIWTAVTLQFSWFKNLFFKARLLFWQAFFFSCISLLIILLFKDLSVPIDDVMVERIFALTSFIFFLQFFLRLMDCPYLKTPHQFLEYTFASGLLLFLSRFLLAVFLFTPNQTIPSFFYEQLFIFFLAFVIIGYLATFFIRAFFISPFFLIQVSKLVPFFSRTIFRLIGYEFKNPMADHTILKGIALSFFISFFILLFLFYQWFLALIVMFFVAYFILFYFLDRQEDMRIRGEVVEER